MCSELVMKYIKPLIKELKIFYYKHYREAGDCRNADVNLSVEDEICRITSIKMSGKVKAFCYYMEHMDTVKV